MEQYNIEYIEKLRIHELRDFARSVGVNSPTTMKKEQLIEEITEKLSGLISKQGRVLPCFSFPKRSLALDTKCRECI